ncbi:MAG: V-type ATP synthase subunit D [Magnetococcales bacterium]|nr:V-type ATP synthase subunit D [Magnetococcales bacterium]
MQISPTRSALLEAKDERRVMDEGYRFLDEKRLLLAAEIIKTFNKRNQLKTEYDQLFNKAQKAMAAAVGRHGLHGLQLQPATKRHSPSISSKTRSFFGVPLVESSELTESAAPETYLGANPSPESKQCRKIFTQLLETSITMAELSNNLQRLLLEYRRTDRRARALEDVILPELNDGIYHIDNQLEEMDQEESVRVRLGRKAF